MNNGHEHMSGRRGGGRNVNNGNIGSGGSDDGEDDTSGSPIEDMVNWLRSVFARVMNATDKDRPITAKVIVHLEHHRMNEKADDVEAYEYSPGDSVEELAEEIAQRASQDAQAIGGGSYFVRVDGVTSRWAISFDGPNVRSASSNNQAMIPRGASSYASGGFGGGGGGGGGGFSRPMMGGGMGGMGGGGYPSENPAAIILQSMVQDKTVQLAHNERLLDLAISGQTDMMRMMKSVVAEQHETLRTYEKERVKSFVLLEEMTSKKHERDMELSKQVKTEERKDKAWGLVEPMALSVAARFFGGKGVPAEMSPIVNMMSSAFSNMDGERLQKIVTSGLFKQEEMMAMMEMFKILKQIEEEAAAKKAAAANSSNGVATNGAT
jgi:uncharacterized spore protein YtfJ